MSTISLILLSVFTLLHLKASFEDDRQKRIRTKPFLLIFIILFYVFSSHNISYFLLIALITSWIGDILLIPKGHKWFTMGGISFIFSHIFFILVYVGNIDISKIPWLLIGILAVLYYGISLGIVESVKDNTPKPMLPLMYFYMVCNSTMNLFAFIQMYLNRNVGSIVAYIGAILFFISDCCLFLVRYHKKGNLIYKKHFTVMLTYILGEFLITLGILMIRG